jgi:hypothetical protein
MGSGDDGRPPSETGSGDDGTGLPLERGELALVGGLVVVLLAGVSLGLGGAGGVGGPAAADGGSTASATATVTGAGTTTATAATDRAPAVTMRVRSIESCGTRCRSVTVALSNDGNAPARDVGVTTRITADGSLVWQGRSDVGRLDAGETVTRTRTIQVGYVDAARIQSNDGVVRIETTVRTAGGTRVFTERRDVL